MRTQYQRRSWTSILIWATAFSAMIGLAAWQFHWWPTTESDRDEIVSQIQKFQSKKAEPSPVQPVHHETPAAEPQTEADLFAAQTEPDFPEPPPENASFQPAQRSDFDFPKPPELLPANPDAKPIPMPSRLVQTVEGELPPLEPLPSAPPEFEPDNSPPIQLLGEETLSPAELPLAAAPATPPAMPAGMEAIQDKISQIDQWLASADPQQELLAHKELSTLYWKHPEWREGLRERIEKTAKSIYFSKQPHYMTPYTVQPGDQLTKIGNLYNVPWQYLATLNQVDPRKIRVGQKLKVIKGPFAAVVDLHRFELTIQHHGFFVKRYKVGIGKDGTSPIGEFKIKNKLTNPTYYGPDGVIGADDPKNPLGEYWIDIGDSYGIHGTIEPDSIGKAESRGCIRMLNDDAAEVYGFLGVGAKVIIRR